jgi:archaellum component FlaD/FlaE
MFERLTSMFGTNDTEQGTDAAGEAGPDDDGAEADADMEWQSGELPDDGGDDRPAEADGGDPASAPDPEPDAAAGPTTEELDVRIEELEDDLESTGASVRAIQSSQEEMADAVDEVNDTVRRLVGVYDRLAAEQNPFLDGPDEAADGATVVGDAAADGTVPADDAGDDAADREPAGGVDDADDTDDADATDAADAADAADDAGATDPATNGADDDGVVSFADLRDDGEGEHDGGGEGEHDGGGGGPAVPSSGTDGTTTGRGAAGSVGGDGGPLLASLPDGYAGEAVAMEWLSTLMAESGAAGAVRAVEHYEDAGWISPAVTRRLVDLVAAPGVDDGAGRLREPTAADHARSYGYVRVLRGLSED